MTWKAINAFLELKHHEFLGFFSIRSNKILSGSSVKRENFVDLCMALLLFHLSGQLLNGNVFLC